jgi:O-antigen/teichoic acid export membrane protein
VPGLLTREEAAKRAGITYNTILLWEKAGRLKPVPRGDARDEHLYISEKELDQVLQLEAQLDAVGIWGVTPPSGLAEPPSTVTVPGRGRRRKRTADGDLAKFAQDSVIKFAGGAANGVFAFLGAIVITRGLHASEAGVFFEALAIYTIVSNTIELGADTGLMRMIPRYRALGRTQDVRRILQVALWPIIPIGTVAAVAMFVFAPQLSRIFTEHAHHGAGSIALVPYIRVFALAVPLTSLTTVILAGTRGFGTMVPSVAINNLAEPAIRPVLVLGVLVAGLGSVAVALAWVAPVALGIPVVVLWLYRLLRRAERRDHTDRTASRPHSDLASEFWRFSWPRGLAAVFSTVVTWLDTLLIGALRTTREAGIYTAATRYTLVGAALIQAVVIVISPLIASMMANREDHPRAELLFQTSVWWLMIPTWPVYFVLITFAPVLLRVFGHTYVNGSSALIILSAAVLFSTGVGPVTAVLLMGGKSSWNMIDAAVALVANVGLNLLLIPRYGINGAAIAWAASIVLINLLSILQVRFWMKLQPFGRGYPIVFVSSAVIFGGLGLATRLIVGASIPAFLGYGAVSSALYLGVLWWFRGTLRLTGLHRTLRLRNVLNEQSWL